MINAKVKVSKEVAAEIEYAKSEYRSIACATQYLLNEADLTDEQVEQALSGYYSGYEVEKSQEERLAEIYKAAVRESKGHFGWNEIAQGQAKENLAEGIKLTLETLGLKIEGVNV
ncbi:hypothetical protein ACIQXW_23360 [Lysinibacillus sp. NPDC097162]|uniref:hypothetical protein n=1 Tax=Lysinibacillus sp. NPDC097162 TaxID=3364140 RepID=UPI0038135BC2